jgi:hypothetical protein
MICSLYHRKLLCRKDLVDFEYNMRRVCLAEGFDGYLEMLEGWPEERRA